MDTPTILVKLAGLLLLAWTIRSIVKHYRDRRAAQRAGGQEEQALSELILNNLLLYLWLAFMLVFSIGMMVNN
jgi:hypothetical protein